MADAFHLLAFHDNDDACETDERRTAIPRWRIAEAVEWALRRGHGTILIEATDDQPSSTPLTTHHLCRDPWCPGGCQ